jgi:hypothetical protein
MFIFVCNLISHFALYLLWDDCSEKNFSNPIVYVPRAPEMQFESPSYFAKSSHTDVGFEVLTAMTVKNTVLWVLLPCTMEKDQTFGGTKLHFQGRTVSQARNQQTQVASSAYFGFLLVLLFFPENGGIIFPQKLAFL